MAVQSIGFLTSPCVTISGIGSISVPGLKVGDKLIGVWNTDSNVWAAPGSLTGASGLEAIITVDDEIQQQISTPWVVGANLLLLLLRQ